MMEFFINKHTPPSRSPLEIRTCECEIGNFVVFHFFTYNFPAIRVLKEEKKDTENYTMVSCDLYL
jgi:hypothetical protein